MCKKKVSRDHRLRELMQFIRDPPKKIPAAIREYWARIQIRDGDSDARLLEARLAGYWVGSHVLERLI